MRFLPLALVLAALTGSLPASPVAAADAGNMTGLLAHPCVLVNAATLPALRTRCADAAPNRFGFATAELWQAIKSRTDKLAALPTYSYSVAIPGEGNVTLEQWSYALSDQTPPPHPKSPAYPPWTAMFQERDDSLTTRLVHFSFAYLVTGERQYYDKAREIALHLAAWEQWTDASYGSGAVKACLDTGHCLYAMGLFYDWCFGALTEGERSLLRRAILEKGIVPALGYVDHYPADTNGYAVITAGAGLAALAIRPEEPAAGGYLQQCLDKTRLSLDSGGKDGGMFEGPMYGTYLVDSFARFLDGLVSARVQHDLFDHPYLKTMDRYCLGLLAPDTRQIPCFSDGSPGVAVPALMSILAQRGSSDAAWYLQQIGALKPTDLYGLLRFDEAALRPREPSWNPSTAFHDIGYASLRDGFNAAAPSLFFKCGPYTNYIGHNHYDQNAFVISYGGQWLVPDRGYHSFYDPARRKFSLGSLGHCTMVLDVDEAYRHDQTVPAPGHEQVLVTGGKIVDFFGGRYFDFVKGAAAEAYNKGQAKVLDRFDRSIVYLKPDLFLVRDQVAASRPHRYSFLVHSDGQGDIAVAPDGSFTLTRGNGQVYGQAFSAGTLRSQVEVYPGAETYGPYLRVETEPLAATSLLTALYPRPYQADNLLRNGGFEKGLGGWSPRAGEDLPHHRVETTGAAEGKQCAAIEKSGYLYSDRFGLPAGTRVTARVRTRTTALPAGEGVTMTLYFWAGGKAFSNKRVGPFAGEQWTEHELEALVPEGTEEVSLALECFAPGTGYFDEARLTTDQKVAPPLTPRFTLLGPETLRVRVGEHRYLTSFGTPGVTRACAGLRTDAELAVVSYREGRPWRVLIRNGSFVSQAGRELLRLPRPGTEEREITE